MKRTLILTGCAASIIALMAFKNKGDINRTAMAEQKTKSIDESNFDKSVKPGDDFYEYVNGNWLKKNPIPSTETRWGSFNILADSTRHRVKLIVEEAARAKDVEKGSAQQKIRDFYNTAMDTVSIDKMGAEPLTPLVKLVLSCQRKEDLVNVIADFHSLGIGCFFNFYVGQDDKNSKENIIFLSQGGLGLPDRDYYLKDDPESKNIREKYVNLINDQMRLANIDFPDEFSSTILKIETELAKNSRTRVALRDPEANYNKMPLTEFLGLVPSLPLKLYFTKFNIQAKDVVVGQPEFFKSLNEMFSNFSLKELQAYLIWHLINERASTLSSEFVNNDFAFYEGVLSGAKEMKPRWKRVLGAMNGTMGELIGQLYVKKYFPPQAKERVTKLVNNLIAAYKERIKTRTWMEEQTKKAAIEKLDKVMLKLAYPDKWKDFSALEVKTDSYYENVNRAETFWFNYNLHKLGKPVDRTEWGMSPQTVNAYYNPGMNEIVFPAAIMQPPFFDPNADDAVNYGGMGVVIGHELTHGFDDQGSQYDADGNLKNWWTEADKARFKQNTAKLAKQFNSFAAIDTFHINGELTLGENIADLGGLIMAYSALQKVNMLQQAVSAGGGSNGFTPEQRFFINYAQIWRNNIRPEELKKRLKVDPHSPGKFRTNGPLPNIPEFYKAFNVTKENKMYLPQEERAEIW